MNLLDDKVTMNDMRIQPTRKGIDLLEQGKKQQSTELSSLACLACFIFGILALVYIVLTKCTQP